MELTYVARVRMRWGCRGENREHVCGVRLAERRKTKDVKADVRRWIRQPKKTVHSR